MTRIRCPYCGSINVSWLNVNDSIDWSDADCGIITTTNIICEDCKEGGRGFSTSVPFILCDDVEYMDAVGNEICMRE